MKHQTQLIIVLTIIAVVALPLFFIVIPANQPIGLPLDVDYLTEGDYAGNFLVTDNIGKVLIVDTELNVLWESDVPERFCHESGLLPDGNIIVADTAVGRVIELNISDPNDIVWEWDPRNPADINWTELAIRAGWSQKAIDYVQNPKADWAHTNDAEWINGTKLGRTYDSLMISLRNFNLILEVNYTDTKEVIWWYGEPEDYNTLNHQHNPDVRDNGNVIICDSENRRIIEVNYTTKEVVWKFRLDFPFGELRWARDCDDIGNDTYMITDSNNGRVFFVDRETKTIVKEFGGWYLIQPYEADYVEIDGKHWILVGDSPSTAITLIDPESDTFIVYGFPSIPNYLRLFVGLFSTYYAFMFISQFLAVKDQSVINRLKKPSVYRELTYLILSIIILIFGGSLYRYLVEFGLWKIMDNAIHNWAVSGNLF
ncbi:MAG: aryl-sulfate sulfotransferase [Candidatus Thorarchaeota archaeon]